MENKNKNQKKGSIIPALVVFTAIALFNAMENPKELAVLVPVFVIAVAIAVIVFAAKKKGGGTSAGKKPGSVSTKAKREPAKPAALAFHHKDEEQAEEAISCHHATGKEKYIRQLDSYLKAGLIDRAEYKVLKERYSKLDIPDDYH